MFDYAQLLLFVGICSLLARQGNGKRLISPPKLVKSPHIQTQQRRLSDDPKDYVVKNLPGLSKDLESKLNVTQYAGFLTIDEKNKGNIYYWMIEAEKAPEKAPLIIWLNGGPGCSSMEGLFLECGPFKLTKDLDLRLNEYSWHKTANIVFVDQPVGTGLSYVEHRAHAKSGKEVAAQFYTFLVKFFQRHKNFLNPKLGTARVRTRDIYIFGESFAGRYLPQISDHVLMQNNLENPSNPVIELKGMGLGNAWVHPVIQYEYGEFAHGLGLMSYGQVKTLKEDFAKCRSNLANKKYYTNDCLGNMDQVLNSVKNPLGYKLNFYDVRHFVHNPSVDFPPGRDLVEKYLNKESVRKAIHAESSHKYVECDNAVYNALAHEDGLSTLAEVERSLEHNVSVLFYNGQWDMMCHHLGTEQLLLHLNWTRASEYHKSNRFVWSAPKVNAPAGFVKKGGGLTFVVIGESGHMVPMDLPDVALDLAARFVHNKPFSDSKQAVHDSVVDITKLDDLQCPVQETPEPDVYLPTSSWLWICFVVAIASSLVTGLAAIACLQPLSTSRGHSIIVELDEQEDESEKAGLTQDESTDEDLEFLDQRTRLKA